MAFLFMYIATFVFFAFLPVISISFHLFVNISFVVFCPNCNFVYFYVGKIFSFLYSDSSYHYCNVIRESHCSGVMGILKVKTWVLLDIPELRALSGTLRPACDYVRFHYENVYCYDCFPLFKVVLG